MIAVRFLSAAFVAGFIVSARATGAPDGQSPVARYNLSAEWLVVLMPAPPFRDCGVGGPAMPSATRVETAVLGQDTVLAEPDVVIDLEAGMWKLLVAGPPPGLTDPLGLRVTYVQAGVQLPADGSWCTPPPYTVNVEAVRDRRLSPSPRELKRLDKPHLREI